MAQQPIKLDGFSVIKRIGTGARSTIYLATDDLTNEKIALKWAVKEYPEDIRIFEQIATEYKVSRQIDHPYIRKCHKLIKKRKMMRVTEVLLSMEMFYGQSLEDISSLSLGDVLLIFRMIATALNAMHEKGYVHCDVKPNNILINKDGSIKIIDLGQSCRIGTVKTRIQGTPDYIAPEQVRREPLGHRTDMFNLGATMYWALTGKNVPTLIPKKMDVGLSQAVADQNRFKTPHEIYSKIPIKISDIVMDCVHDNPAKRPSNMMEIIARLDILIKDIFGSKTQ